MSVPGQHIQELFQKLVTNRCTEQELEIFFQLVRELPDDDPLIAQLDAWWDKVEAAPAKDLVRERRIWQQVIEQTNPAESLPAAPVIRMQRHRRWWAAASIMLLVAAAAFFYFLQQNTNHGRNTHIVNQVAEQIEPGKDGAILTLQDGTQVVLDSMQNGVIADQPGAKVMLQDGSVSYNASGDKKGNPAWNTITTPKGRQFKIALPDGTRVWMNAASSITYPTWFAGLERRIEISGEVYLEVARDPSRKFKVKVNNEAVVEVTGTQFNVKAYSDEPSLATTLVEGGVRLYEYADASCWQCTVEEKTQKTPAAVSLRPGQQGVMKTNSKNRSDNKGKGNILVLNNVNTDRVMAWKNGFFNFEGMTLNEAMNQLMRWYNIEVVYEDTAPQIEFFGEISRNISLADLLKALEDVGVQFRIESGRKLIVLPK